MSDEIPLTFDHPEARAAATAGPDPLDRIILRDLERAVEIGAFQQERGQVQRLRFNIVVEVHIAAETPGDDVDQILSYDALSEAVDAALATDRLNLLETLAARIADRILAHPLAARLFLRIEKLDRGPYVLGVEIVRSATRAQAAGTDTDTETDTPRPRVVYLGNATLARDDLGAVLDGLAGQGAPLILCVGPGDTPVPQAADASAQRHIDLLAIDQNAWALSARAPRAVVSASRTELDWGLKNGRIAVWAPAKLVLDSFDSPDTITGEALALWLARQFGAVELVVHGGTAPQSDSIKITQLPATNDI